MAFKQTTIKDFSDRIKTTIASRLGTGVPSDRSMIGALSYSLAGAFYLLQSFLVFILDQVFPSTASEQYLLRHAALRGIERKPATLSTRDVLFLGVNGSVIPAGTIVQDDSGAKLISQNEATISDGQALVLFNSEDVGSPSGFTVGSNVSLESPLAGVETIAAIQSTNYIDGTDIEPLSELRERIILRNSSPISGGRASDYIQWALEVPGVTRAWVYPHRLGIGSVGVSFVLDNEVDIIPNQSKVDEVYNYIDELRPITAGELQVFAPTPVSIDLVIDIFPNTEGVRTQVTSQLEELFKTKSSPEGSILFSHLNEAISLAQGEQDHKITSHNDDIEAGLGEMLLLGNITFNTLVYE